MEHSGTEYSYKSSLVAASGSTFTSKQKHGSRNDDVLDSRSLDDPHSELVEILNLYRTIALQLPPYSGVMTDSVLQATLLLRCTNDMPEDSKPEHREGFVERIFHYHLHHQQEEDPPQPQDKEEEGEHDKEDHPHHESRMQRLKEYLQNQDELDEAGETYAWLM